MQAANVRKSIAALIAAVACTGIAAAPASADYLKRELSGGIGQAITSDGAGGHYVGGSFTAWNADQTGGGFVLKDMTYSGDSPSNSGTLDRAYKAFDGGLSSIRTVVPDGSGGWYVGGTFTRYGKVKTNNVAHIKSDGTLDTAFQANVPYTGWGECGNSGGVNALLLDGDTLYIGGKFDTVNGTARRDLAAVDATTGALKSFDAGIVDATPSCSGVSLTGVSALLRDGSSLFVGGNFASVGGAANSKMLAKVDATTGASDSTFNSAASPYAGITCFSQCDQYTVAAIAKVGSDLWVGSNAGYTGTVGNASLLVINPATKAVDSAKSAKLAVTVSGGGGSGLEAGVQAIVTDGAGSVYVGGTFNQAGAYPNLRTVSGVAKFDLASQTYSSSFNANLVASARNCWGSGEGLISFGSSSSSVAVTGLTLDGGSLLVTGRFESAGGDSRSGLAAVSASTGALDSDFAPANIYSSIGCGSQGSGKGFGTPAEVAKGPDGSLFVGGYFEAVGGDSVGGLIHVKADGTRDTAFNADVKAKTNIQWGNGGCYWWCLTGVTNIVKVGSKLYIGGAFDSVGGNTGLNAAAVLNVADGSLASRQISGTFRAQRSNSSPTPLRGAGDPSISDIEVDGSKVWFAGSFEYVEGSAKSIGIVAIDTATDTKTAFTTAPWIGGTTSSGGGTCYDDNGDPYPCGGGGTTTYAAPGVRSIALNAGKVYVTSADPRYSTGSSTVPTGNDGPQGTNLTDFGLFALNASTGAPVSGTLGQGIDACQANAGIGGTCFKGSGSSLTFVGGRLFIGGQFTKVGGVNRAALAEVDPDTGAVKPFDLQLTAVTNSCSGCQPGVFKTLTDGSSLFVAGWYQNIGGKSRGGISQVDLSNDTVTGFDPLDGSNFNAPGFYLDPSNGKLYVAGFRYYPNDTDYPTVGLILEPTLKYSADPILDQTTFGYMVTLRIRPPSAPVVSVPANGSSSNANAVTFTGGDGNTFECKLDTGDWAACTSPFDVSSLPEGSHTFAVRQTDDQGRTSAETTVTWVRDITPPSAPNATLSSPTLTSGATASTSAQFSFDLPAGASKVQCQLDGGAWADCTSPKSVSGLADGQHTMKFRSVDAAGNTSPEQSIVWGVYSTAPAAPTITAPADGSTSNTNSVTFTQVAGLTYTCEVDGGTPVACTSPFDVSGLADGSHTVKVRAVDPLGNTSSPTAVTWTRDTTMPAAPTLVSKPSDPSSQASGQITFTGEAGATFECQLDAGAWGSCTSPYPYSSLADGSHTFAVRAVKDGKTSDPTSHTWTVDTTAPAAPTITSHPDATTTSSDASFSFTGSGAAGSSFECKVDAGSWAPCSSPLALSLLTIGSHSLQVREVDAAGNRSEAASFSWTVQSPGGLPCTPRPTPPTPRKAVTLTRVRGNLWRLNAGAVFNTGGDTRGCAQLLTVQIRTLIPRPGNEDPGPDGPSYARGIVAWTGGSVERASKSRPRWIRVENRIGRWSGWIEVKR